MPERSIVLMGLRGSGKSTVGRILAGDLGLGFIDLDDRTLGLLREQGGGMTIAEAFERFAEARALRSVLTESAGRPSVIALGGGTPTAPGAGDALLSAGAVRVYLRLSPGVLRERLRGKIDANRPALSPGSDALAEIDRIYEQRDPLYATLAQIVIEEDLPPEETAGLIRDEVARLA